MSSTADDPNPVVVTGYPAPAFRSNVAPLLPPFNPPPPPSAYAPPPRDDDTFVLIALAVIVLLCMLTVPIVHHVLRPRIPEFAVSSACVTGFILSAQQQQLSASFDLNLTVHSPNRDRIYYEHVTASVLYASDILSERSLASFSQGKGETTVLRARLAVLGRKYVNSDVVRGIESDRGRGDGAVGFNVRVFSWVRFPGALGTSWYTLSVHCDGVLISFRNGTNAATTGCLLGSAPKKCVVVNSDTSSILNHQ
ncbi:uncharacterized protein LOC141822730 [Curcuma longa]|uniref:uncharacterized protein LOC141822730 n=1 Tax=Curcuma longa TaxID=136217 RepID=UPI003D9EC6B9